MILRLILSITRLILSLTTATSKARAISSYVDVWIPVYMDTVYTGIVDVGRRAPARRLSVCGCVETEAGPLR